jgi:hypothetical protein
MPSIGLSATRLDGIRARTARKKVYLSNHGEKGFGARESRVEGPNAVSRR